MSPTLSAIVITRNEAATIGRCLDSLSFANERIVIDSGSTDNTIALAAHCGAKTFTRAWSGYGDQKNFGATLASSEWLLFVDADEVVPVALQSEITKAINMNGPSFFWLRMVTIFLGKPLRHLYGHNPRLFRKGAGRWTKDTVHEQVEHSNGDLLTLGDSFSTVLPSPLLHYSHRTVASYLTKMHNYTTLDAQRMVTTAQHRSGRAVHASQLLPWYLSVRQFIKLLIYRRGFLDGYKGILWCILSAYYEYEMGVKFLALARNSSEKLKVKN